MNALPEIHPAEETLIAYGLGKADETTASTVARHLESCSACRSRVASLPADSFVDRLKMAKSPGASSLPNNSLSTLGHGDSARESGSSLPRELAGCGQYEDIRELGKGGMGVVYVARNKLMGREEVLKVVNKSMLERPGAVERFLREIQSAAKLQHPNVVAAYSAMQLDELLVFAMEYVPGQDLAQVVRNADRPMPVANACYYVHQTALGLQHAYEKGMVHRDIKPSNLILTKDGKKSLVKILDFGLAKVSSEKGFDTGLTGEGKMLGTPDFMSPEQALDAAKADIRADIYSLGCTLYYLLIGRPPFAANSLLELLQHHQGSVAQPLNLLRPDIPVELGTVVAQMMAKDPRKRYQTPAEVAKVLVPFVKPGVATKPVKEVSLGAGKTATTEPVQSQPAVKAMEPEIDLEVVRPPATNPTVPVSNQSGVDTWENLSETGETRPGTGVRRAPVGSAAKKRPWLWPAVAGGIVLVAILVALAVTVFKVSTPDGVLVVEVNEPDAEVYIDGNLVTVCWDNGGKKAEINIKPGTRKVEVKKDGFKAFGEEVTLEDGKRKILVAKLDQIKPPVKLEMAKGPEERTEEFEYMIEGEKKKGSRRVIELDIGGGEKMEFVRIVRGSFLMGSRDGEKLVDSVANRHSVEIADSDEKQHYVEITKDFYLGKYEVTQGQYKAVAGVNPSRFQGDRLPVDSVSWEEAVKYCEKLQTKLKRKIVLPSEAQWEFACRAGTTSPFHFGSKLNGDLANCKGTEPYGTEIKGVSKGKPVEVGSYMANPWGLYDMQGNVWEWCEDWRGPYEKVTDKRDPIQLIKQNDNYRILRGGSWYYDAWHSRAAYRNRGAPDVHNYDIGFRVAIVIGGNASDETPLSKTKVEAALLPPPPPSAALQALRRNQLPPEALAVAGDGDPSKAPASLVGVWGEVVPIHTEAVLSLAYSPDGLWLASGSADKSILVRDAATGNVKRILKGHSGVVSAVSFSKDSKTLVSASHDGTIKLWSVEKEEELKTIRPDLAEIWSLAASPDGRFLAAGGLNRPIVLWKWGQWDKPVNLPALKGKVQSLSFSPNGELLASSWDSVVRLYKTSDGTAIQTWPADKSNQLVTFHRDGKWLITNGELIKIWEVESGKLLAKGSESFPYNALALHPDGKNLYASNGGGTLGLVFDMSIWLGTATGPPSKVFREPNGICSAAYHPSGKYLALGTNSGAIHIWDTNKWEKQSPKQGHSHYITALSISSDGRTILTGGDDNILRRWDIGNRKESKFLQNLRVVLSHASLSPDASKFVTSGSFIWYDTWDRGVVWDAVTGKQQFLVEPRFNGHSAVFSPDSKLIAACDHHDQCVLLWDAATGKLVQRFPKVGKMGVCLDVPAFSGDGKTLAVATTDTKMVKICDIDSGEEIHSWEDGAMCAIALSKDGRLLATGHHDGSISLWDMTDRTRKKQAWVGHAGRINRMKFTPDGKTMVSSSDDGTIRLWHPELARAQEIIAIGPSRRTVTFDLDPSGKYLFAAGHFPVIFILRLPGIVEQTGAGQLNNGSELKKNLDPDRKAAEYVLSIGGVVRIDDEVGDIRTPADLPRKAFRLTYVDLRDNPKLRNADMIAFNGCTNIKYLNLQRTQIKDEGLAFFKDCKDLTYIDLWCAQVKDEGMAIFKDFKKLTHLGCESTLVMDLSWLQNMKLTYLNCKGTLVKDLAPLKNMNLNYFDCTNTHVSDLSPLKGMKLTSLICANIPAQNLMALTGMPLNTLVCNDMPVSDLSPLDGMPLTHLYCHHTQVADLMSLKHMKLTELDLTNTNVSDLSPLKGMQLTRLSCIQTPITDAGLAGLQDVSSLRHLEICGTKITDAGLEHLKKLTDLEVLTLYDNKLTGAGLVYLKGMAKLTHLSLERTQVTDESLVHLMGMQNLVILHIGQTRVTDAGLEHILGLKNLAELRPSGVGVTDKGVAKLKADLPKCNIIR